jgi:formylglycine-generating enzyme required for sulfatase activity
MAKSLKFSFIASVLLLGLAFVTGGTGTALGQTPGPETGKVFRDCPECPEMVVVPAGRFMMGSPANDPKALPDEFPQHEVVFQRPFAVGRFEVTRQQYEVFAKATGLPETNRCWMSTNCVNCTSGRKADRFMQRTNKKSIVEVQGSSWRNPGWRQADNEPVLCVSWLDAMDYLAWLSQRTGQRYRLLTESEWEYAARANTTGYFAWDLAAADNCKWVNGADDEIRAVFGYFPDASTCSDGFTLTAPGGTYPANSFGLYDMYGNVWEWTSDCYVPDHGGSPADGSSRQDGSCDVRVTRGGSFWNPPDFLRSARRNREVKELRSMLVGFRLARDL